MKKIVCDLCGESDFVKVNGFFECQVCGAKYTIEEARSMFVEVDDPKEKTSAQVEEDAFEEDVKKALQEKQSEANQERSEAMDYYEDMDKDYNFDSDGYIWQATEKNDILVY